MGSRRRLAALALLIPVALAATVALTACGSGASASGAASGTTVEERLAALELISTHQRRAAYYAHVRQAVVRGAARDFAAGTGIGGPRFAACVEGLLGEALDAPRISDLAAVYRRPGGSAYAAQALNAIAAPLAADCGHRAWVPELTDAARGLSFTRPTGAAARHLGVSYGPYLGARCDLDERRHCEKVGIDLVFRQAATRVVAIAGDQRIRLRTPGMHSLVRYRDWVGTFTEAGILPDRPFELHHEPIHTGVEIRVRFASGRRAQAFFPHVLISSGWG